MGKNNFEQYNNKKNEIEDIKGMAEVLCGEIIVKDESKKEEADALYCKLKKSDKLKEIKKIFKKLKKLSEKDSKEEKIKKSQLKEKINSINEKMVFLKNFFKQNFGENFNFPEKEEELFQLVEYLEKIKQSLEDFSFDDLEENEDVDNSKKIKDNLKSFSETHAEMLDFDMYDEAASFLSFVKSNIEKYFRHANKKLKDKNEISNSDNLVKKENEDLKKNDKDKSKDFFEEFENIQNNKDYSNEVKEIYLENLLERINYSNYDSDTKLVGEIIDELDELRKKEVEDNPKYRDVYEKEKNDLNEAVNENKSDNKNKEKKVDFVEKNKKDKIDPVENNKKNQTSTLKQLAAISAVKSFDELIELIQNENIKFFNYKKKKSKSNKNKKEIDTNELLDTIEKLKRLNIEEALELFKTILVDNKESKNKALRKKIQELIKNKKSESKKNVDEVLKNLGFKISEKDLEKELKCKFEDNEISLEQDTKTEIINILKKYGVEQDLDDVLFVIEDTLNNALDLEAEREHSKLLKYHKKEMFAGVVIGVGAGIININFKMTGASVFKKLGLMGAGVAIGASGALIRNIVKDFFNPALKILKKKNKEKFQKIKNEKFDKITDIENLKLITLQAIKAKVLQVKGFDENNIDFDDDETIKKFIRNQNINLEEQEEDVLIRGIRVLNEVSNKNENDLLDLLEYKGVDFSKILKIKNERASKYLNSGLIGGVIGGVTSATKYIKNVPGISENFTSSVLSPALSGSVAGGLFMGNAIDRFEHKRNMDKRINEVLSIIDNYNTEDENSKNDLIKIKSYLESGILDKNPLARAKAKSILMDYLLVNNFEYSFDKDNLIDEKNELKEKLKISNWKKVSHYVLGMTAGGLLGAGGAYLFNGNNDPDKMSDNKTTVEEIKVNDDPSNVYELSKKELNDVASSPITKGGEVKTIKGDNDVVYTDKGFTEEDNQIIRKKVEELKKQNIDISNENNIIGSGSKTALVDSGESEISAHGDAIDKKKVITTDEKKVDDNLKKSETKKIEKKSLVNSSDDKEKSKSPDVKNDKKVVTKVESSSPIKKENIAGSESFKLDSGIKIESNDSVWSVAKKYLAANDSFEADNQNINKVKNIIVANPQKYGLLDEIKTEDDFRKLSIENLKNIKWQDAFDDAILHEDNVVEKLEPISHNDVAVNSSVDKNIEKMYDGDWEKQENQNIRKVVFANKYNLEVQAVDFEGDTSGHGPDGKLDSLIVRDEGKDIKFFTREVNESENSFIRRIKDEMENHIKEREFLFGKNCEKYDFGIDDLKKAGISIFDNTNEVNIKLDFWEKHNHDFDNLDEFKLFFEKAEKMGIDIGSSDARIFEKNALEFVFENNDDLSTNRMKNIVDIYLNKFEILGTEIDCNKINECYDQVKEINDSKVQASLIKLANSDEDNLLISKGDLVKNAVGKDFVNEHLKGLKTRIEPTGKMIFSFDTKGNMSNLNMILDKDGKATIRWNHFSFGQEKVVSFKDGEGISKAVDCMRELIGKNNENKNINFFEK